MSPKRATLATMSKQTTSEVGLHAVRVDRTDDLEDDTFFQLSLDFKSGEKLHRYCLVLARGTSRADAAYALLKLVEIVKPE